MKAEPRRELPFCEQSVRYMALMLRACDIEPDREWLRVRQEWSPPVFIETALYEEWAGLIRAGRERLPKTQAPSELTEFFRYAIVPAIHSVLRLESWDEFQTLFRRLFGEKALPLLPSLFLAAAAVPSVTAEHGRKLICSFDPCTLED